MGTAAKIRPHSANGVFAGISVIVEGPRRRMYWDAVEGAVHESLALDEWDPEEFYGDDYDPEIEHDSEWSVFEFEESIKGEIALPTEYIYRDGTVRTVRFTPGGEEDVRFPAAFDETRERREAYLLKLLQSMNRREREVVVTKHGLMKEFIADDEMRPVEGER